MISRRPSPWTAAAAYAAFPCGVSLTYVFAGAQSPAYFAAIGGAFALLALVLGGRRTLLDSAVPAITAACVPLAVFFLQTLFLDPIRFEPDVAFAAAMTAGLLLAWLGGLLDRAELARAMLLIALGHAALSLAALQTWEGLEGQRFSAYDIPTAAWAETAFGMAAAAVLSRSVLTLVIACAVAAALLILTEMRGAGLATLAMILLYAGALVPAKDRALTAFFGAVAAALGLLLFGGQAGESLSDALLLSDPHRGIDSGFSGRFDNWSAAGALIADSPLIGAGIGDATARYAHNGFIMMTAELGLLFALPFAALLATALWRSVQLRDAGVFAVTFGYVLLILTAPRYINFSVAIMVPLTAMAHVLLTPVPPRAPRPARRPGSAFQPQT